uniref:Uncharacterized protein n=1 Tax=Anguilla anguilla TaxID=7936 RepID=A0A0E9Q1X8_ANGAN
MSHFAFSNCYTGFLTNSLDINFSNMTDPVYEFYCNLKKIGPLNKTFKKKQKRKKKNY